MPRFLTPSTIALLCLVELYTDGVVPGSSTIPFLSFILNQVLPSTLSAPQHKSNLKTQDLPFVPDLKSFETLLSSVPFTWGVPGRHLWNGFLTKLWEIDSLDALHVFFAQRSVILAKTREEAKKDGEIGTPPVSPNTIILSRSSPLGTFVRRCRVEFERLKFSDAQSLWTAFVRWRHETRAYWARKSGMLSRWAGDQGLNGGEDIWGAEATEMLELVAYGNWDVEDDGKSQVSSEQVERILEFQVERMQRLGNRIPVEVENKLKDMLNDSQLIPSLSHYLNFLDAWRAGDYSSSFDNLHRYFDYTMQNRDRLFYQYALMNLAVLQADFGCFDEAVAAMLETVSTARENRDMHCLNFALNWLYHFGKSHPKLLKETESANRTGVEREGLAYLRIKAKESGMWTLWSSTLLSEAKLGMSNGESVATAFENILKSSHVILDNNLKPMMGPQTALVSHLWARLGVMQLATQYAEIYLIIYARYGLFDDILRHTCRIAHLSAEKGRYYEAMQMLEILDENSMRSWKSNQLWLKYKGFLRLKRNLHHNKLNGAELLLSQLLQQTGEEVDPDLNFEINMLYVDYLIRRTDLSGALAKIEELAAVIEKDGEDINMRVRLLTMKALLQDKCGRPQKGFSVAVRAASIAWRARLIPGLWAAMGAIANILTSLSEFHASAQILTSIIPRALEYDNRTLSAQLYSFLVDAYMGMAGQAEQASLKRREYLTKCLEFIDRCFTEYSAQEDIKGQCEMMAKKSTVMKVLGDKVNANVYASAYLGLKRAVLLPTDY